MPGFFTSQQNCIVITIDYRHSHGPDINIITDTNMLITENIATAYMFMLFCVICHNYTEVGKNTKYMAVK